MTISRLRLYNDALMLCGERSLASLTEEREPRRLLDQAWDSDVVKKCLEMADWNFARRTVQIDADPDIEPDFGYQNAFNKPTDWVSTSGLCSDEYLRSPLTAYVEEAGNWYSDCDPIYVSYVSNDSSYGGDLSLWPQTFADYVAAVLAGKIVLKLTSDANVRQAILGQNMDGKGGLIASTLLTARNKDAKGRPTSFPPSGSWVRARRGGRGGDGGSNSRLTG